MKKILQIISLPPPVHGSNIMNRYVKKSDLINNEFDVTVLKYNFVNSVSEIGNLSFKKFFHFLLIVFRLLNLLFSKKFDLVYFPIVPYGISFLRDSIIVFILKLFNKKIIFHMHGKGIQKNYVKHKLIYDYVFNNTSSIILSNFLSYDLKFLNTKLYVLNNGIENYPKSKKTKQYEKIKILYVSNFILEKGVLDLIDSISLINDIDVNFELNLVGNFTNEISEEYLRSKIKSLNLSEIINLVGPMYGQQKNDIFSESHLFVFPTYYPNECFPLVLLEACQFSLPIISTFEGAIPDIVTDNYNGYLVEQRNIEELSNKILEVITDKKKMILFSNNANEKFHSTYTLQKFENNLLKILKSELCAV